MHANVTDNLIKMAITIIKDVDLKILSSNISELKNMDQHDIEASISKGPEILSLDRAKYLLKEWKEICVAAERASNATTNLLQSTDELEKLK